MPDSGHIARMILALPWSQSDNNNNTTSSNNNNNNNKNNNNNDNNNNNSNSAIFVRLLNTNPKSPGSLSTTRNITDSSM